MNEHARSVGAARWRERMARIEMETSGTPFLNPAFKSGANEKAVEMVRRLAPELKVSSNDWTTPCLISEPVAGKPIVVIERYCLCITKPAPEDVDVEALFQMRGRPSMADPLGVMPCHLPLQSSFCCSHTYREDEYIPYVEKELTFYLYYKLFPERFEQRPDFTEYSARAYDRIAGVMQHNPFFVRRAPWEPFQS